MSVCLKKLKEELKFFASCAHLKKLTHRVVRSIDESEFITLTKKKGLYHLEFSYHGYSFKYKNLMSLDDIYQKAQECVGLVEAIKKEKQ